MVLHGTYKNGVVELDERGTLAEGQRVTVKLEESPSPERSTVWQKLLEVAGTIEDGPADASRNHDHYIYGAPKREEGGA